MGITLAFFSTLGNTPAENEQLAILAKRGDRIFDIFLYKKLGMTNKFAPLDLKLLIILWTSKLLVGRRKNELFSLSTYAVGSVSMSGILSASLVATEV